MTCYHGGKKKIGKDIAKSIIEHSKNNPIQIEGYFEPFCGMLGVYSHILDYPRFSKYLANDINNSVIKMWEKSKNGWNPPLTCSEVQYYEMKHNGETSPEKGFIGHVFSYRGTYFDSYFKHKESKIKANLDNVKRISSNLNNVVFSNKSYDEFEDIKNFIIYCDPPYDCGEQRYYTGTEKHYSERLKFNSELFWLWCKKMAKNNIVFVSEYTAPNDVDIIKIFEKGKEKLFLVK